MKKIIVIGGGAAGMMAALTASKYDAEVILIEQNEKLGKKVFITGKGRCNVTNAGDTSDFFDFVNTNSKFLYSSIYSFDAFAVMELIEKNGCRLKTERGNRVFPASDHSSDIISSFERALIDNKVQIRKNMKVTDILQDNGKCIGIRTERGMMQADAVIMCVGGKSYESTGSDGVLLTKLGEHGIRVKPLNPGLVPLNSPDPVCKKLMGLSLKNVTLDIFVDKKNIYSGFGEMLFTHFGISGPLVLTASSLYSSKYRNHKAIAFIDLKPALTVEKLDERILRDFDAGKNKDFINVLEGLLPKSLAAEIPSIIKVPEHKKVHDITAEERKKLVQTIKAFKLNINGTRDFNEAIITIGGVDVKEIDPSTMESKKIKNLYFAGEMIDVDAYTGGYNLQIAWSTGHLAGESAAN